jgi:NitT/TauT family transport system substrate-binding protein
MVLQLNWIPDAQHGGFYAAQVLGYFADEGLDVRILPGGPGTAAIPKLTMGRCDFAVGNADQVLLAREQGADVVAVFAAMQDSPRCIMVHESSGIKSLDQIKDLTLALGEGKVFAEYLRANVPLENVRIVSYNGAVAKFLIDKNFAQQGYVFSEPLVARARGGDPRVLMMSGIGFNPYSSVLMTRRELLDHPQQLDKVQRFVRAVRRGWRSYLDDPAEVNEAILKDNPDMDIDILAESTAAIRPLCLTENSELGAMRLDRWSTLRSQLIDLRLLPLTTPGAETAFVELEMD